MNRRKILSLSGAALAMALAGCRGGDGGGDTETAPGTDGRPTSSPTGTPTRRSTATRGPTATEPPTATESPTSTESPTATETATETPTETPPGPLSEFPTGEPSAEDPRLAELVAGNAAFALDLHDYLADTQGGNVFASPYSVSVALAMSFAGARGETREQMRETLRYTLGADVHPAIADLSAALEARETTTEGDEERDAVELTLANAMWGREGLEFADSYRDLIAERYSEEGLRRADFAGDPEGARERINQWVAERTNDRIEELLPPDAVTPSVALVLTNAIYFAAGWSFQFDPEQTEDGTFTALDGTESTVPLMRQELSGDPASAGGVPRYASVPGAKALQLPYVGGDVAMVLIKPDGVDLPTLERWLDAERLFGLFGWLGLGMGTVVLPRFEYETSVGLSAALGDMGMERAFAPAADFGGMVADDSDGYPIGEVFHETFVSVDEEGTEAAASTGVVHYDSGVSDFGELRFDEPFLFCVRDVPTDAVLFLGRVVDAGAAQGE